MPNFREARETLLYCYSENLLTDEEFCLLYDLNTSKNPDFDYTCYNKFDLNEMSDDDVVAEFRFMKNDIVRLVRALNMPNEITCYFYNDLKVDPLEALCVVLSRIAYPCRYFNMISRFGRAVPQLSMIFNQTIDFIDSNWGHLLQNMNQPWLTPGNLMLFANAIHMRGAALDNFWGFIDGTVRACCRPKVAQRMLYNGHKRHHALKYRAVSTPNGLVANLYGPVESKRHDCALLAMSGLLQTL